MRTTSRLVTIACLVVGMVAATVPAQAQSGIRVASLTGAKEVPGPGDADGFGRVAVVIHPARHTVCFAMSVEDITLPAAAAHIHTGRAGVAGDIVVTLVAPNDQGVSSGCVTDLSRALLRNIKENPRLYYVNVHTSDLPSGAIRGQLHR